MMMSSETSEPLSITCLAATPSGEPAFSAARNMSPVEICGMSYASLMNVACVPLPAPGGPSNINRISPLRAFLQECASRCRQDAAHAFQVFRRVHARCRRATGDVDDYPVTMPQCAQLLERLAVLDRRAREQLRA